MLKPFVGHCQAVNLDDTKKPRLTKVISLKNKRIHIRIALKYNFRHWALPLAVDYYYSEYLQLFLYGRIRFLCFSVELDTWKFADDDVVYNMFDQKKEV